MVDSDAPILKGTLAERPLPRLLFFLYRKKITGRIALKEDSGERTVIFLRQGVPVHVDRADPLDRLDRVMADAGTVPPAKIEQAERTRAETGRRLGDVLGMMGVGAEVVADGLKEQLRRKLTRLFFLSRAKFDVYEDEHKFGRDGDFEAVRTPVTALILAGIRSGYDDTRLSREMSPVVGRVVRLGGGVAADLADMGFGKTEEPLLAALRASEGLRYDEIAGVPGRLIELKATLLALLYCDMLEIRSVSQRLNPLAATRPAVTPATGVPTGAASSAGGSRPSPPASGYVGTPGAPPPGWLPPRSRGVGGARTLSNPAGVPAAKPGAEAGKSGPADTGDVRKALLELAGKLDKLNLFEVLGVPENAQPADVNAGYLRLVKRFHPDRLRGLGLMDLRAEAERVMSKASEASAVLSDAARRAEYTKNMKWSDADRAKAMAVVDAELAYQKGDALLKKADWKQAEACFAEAVKGNPDEPEHKALLAWTRFANPATANKDRAGNEAIAALQAAVKQRPRFARGHYLLGDLWKQRSDLARAEQAFRAALTADPSHMEAQRELRLIELRKKEKPGGGSGGGLMDRLRGKKP